jgi:spore maturation protein CgeB
MQICDNKKHLPTLFELGKEVIGFDNVAECADATRYYLAHDDERRAIALAGYRRVMRDYTEDKWWERIPTVIEQDFRRHAAARIDKAVPVR